MTIETYKKQIEPYKVGEIGIDREKFVKYLRTECLDWNECFNYKFLTLFVLFGSGSGFLAESYVLEKYEKVFDYEMSPEDLLHRTALNVYNTFVNAGSEHFLVDSQAWIETLKL